MADEPTFTSREALATTAAMRQELGLGEEAFSIQAFVGMISDEIEQLRDKGRDDEAIAAMVSKATGKAVSADLITRYYAPPGRRGAGHD